MKVGTSSGVEACRTKWGSCRALTSQLGTDVWGVNAVTSTTEAALFLFVCKSPASGFGRVISGPGQLCPCRLRGSRHVPG